MEEPTELELETLYKLRAYIQMRIDVCLRDSKADEVTWMGTSQYEQRCYRCGEWISLGTQIAGVRLVESDGTIVQRYIHERCIVNA